MRRRRDPELAGGARPRPADLVADGLRRRRAARQPLVRLYDAAGAATTLDDADERFAALLRATAQLVDATAPDG